jgi:hypothetical protein
MIWLCIDCISGGALATVCMGIVHNLLSPCKPLDRIYASIHIYIYIYIYIKGSTLEWGSFKDCQRLFQGLQMRFKTC